MDDDVRQFLMAFAEILKGQQESLARLDASVKVLRQVIVSAHPDQEAAEKQIISFEQEVQKLALEELPKLEALLQLVKVGKLGKIDS